MFVEARFLLTIYAFVSTVTSQSRRGGKHKLVLGAVQNDTNIYMHLEQGKNKAVVPFSKLLGGRVDLKQHGTLSPYLPTSLPLPPMPLLARSLPPLSPSLQYPTSEALYFLPHLLPFLPHCIFPSSSLVCTFHPYLKTFECSSNYPLHISSPSLPSIIPPLMFDFSSALTLSFSNLSLLSLAA